LQAAKVWSSFVQKIRQMGDRGVSVQRDYAQVSNIIFCWCYELISKLGFLV
jgi:hypothetical protein